MLVIMLIVLIQRVFELFKEPEAAEVLFIPRPGTEVPDTLRPDPVPPPPRLDIRNGYTQLARRNPFTVRSGGAGATDVTPESLGLGLRRIQLNRDGELRAQIDTETASRKWYREGEQFEAYQLQSIDKEADSVVVYSIEHNRTFTLKR